MEQDSLREILVETVQQRSIIVGLIWLIALVGLVDEIVKLKRPKKRKHEVKRRLGPTATICLAVLLLLLLPILHIPWLLPAMRDIKECQFIQVEAEYSREEFSSRHFLTNGYVMIKTETKTLKLELPSNASDILFPKTTQAGTVWYAKESGIILCFTPSSG